MGVSDVNENSLRTVCGILVAALEDEDSHVREMAAQILRDMEQLAIAQGISNNKALIILRSSLVSAFYGIVFGEEMTDWHSAHYRARCNPDQVEWWTGMEVRLKEAEINPATVAATLEKYIPLAERRGGFTVERESAVAASREMIIIPANNNVSEIGPITAMGEKEEATVVPTGYFEACTQAAELLEEAQEALGNREYDEIIERADDILKIHQVMGGKTEDVAEELVGRAIKALARLGDPRTIRHLHK